MRWGSSAWWFISGTVHFVTSVDTDAGEPVLFADTATLPCMVLSTGSLQITNTRSAWVRKRSLAACRPVRCGSHNVSTSSPEAKQQKMSKAQAKVCLLYTLTSTLHTLCGVWTSPVH